MLCLIRKCSIESQYARKGSEIRSFVCLFSVTQAFHSMQNVKIIPCRLDPDDLPAGSVYLSLLMKRTSHISTIY